MEQETTDSHTFNPRNLSPNEFPFPSTCHLVSSYHKTRIHHIQGNIGMYLGTTSPLICILNGKISLNHKKFPGVGGGGERKKTFS